MCAFFSRPQVQKLDEKKYGAAQSYFIEAANNAKAAVKAKAAAKAAAKEKARRAYVSEAAKDRKHAHRASLAAYKAKRLG